MTTNNTPAQAQVIAQQVTDLLAAGYAVAITNANGTVIPPEP